MEILKMLIETGQYGAIFIALFALHYWSMNRLIKKMSSGVCRGNTDKCIFNIAKSQANMIRAKMQVLKQMIHSSFAFDLMHALEDKSNGHAIPSVRIADIIASHEQLIEYSFRNVESELKRILLENGIPTVGSEDFNKFVKEKMDYIWAMVWDTYQAKYSSRIYILHLEQRRDAQELKKREYYSMMFDLIETGKKIAEKGGK